MKRNEFVGLVQRGLVSLIIGLFWGDEGKGKAILDLIRLYKYLISARFQGGPNAGHTLVLEDGRKFTAHIIPSGVAEPSVTHLLIGNDVVCDPVKLVKEIAEAEALGMEIKKRLYISSVATIISPYHILLDAAAEWYKARGGNQAIGTTKSGIGPAYADAASRDALKFGMINWGNKKFEALVSQANERHEMILAGYCALGMQFSDAERQKLDTDILAWHGAIIQIRYRYHICDMNALVEKLLAEGKNILAEGAQGVMLDVAFGDYPYTTSSVTTAHAVFHGLGIGPQDFGTLIGVMKPYITKVGGGTLPSRMPQKIEEYFQEEGMEIGATTGRKRMCGYMDFVVLRYVLGLLRGFGKIELFITKADIFPKRVKEMIAVTKHIRKNGVSTSQLIFPLSEVRSTETTATSIWRLKPGLRDQESCSGDFDIFINELRNAIDGLPAEVKYIGTGPRRGDFIEYTP